MKSLPFALCMAVLLFAGSLPAWAAEPSVSPVASGEGTDAVPAPIVVGGRTVGTDDGLAYQWPGVHFQTRFSGDGVLFEVGPGDVILHVEADGARIASLRKPAPGRYRIAGLGPGEHRVRIDAATESQAGPNRFGGFLLPPGSAPLAPPQATRRIEFIGDSHTVGYGSASGGRDCSDAQVWETTDTTLAFGPRLAAAYGADYRVNAISGRGIVRNYGGMPGDTLPQAYPWLLFDHSVREAGPADWQPQLVVIALGTNDFSTPLAAGERWATRQALHQDYEQIYAGFVRMLRARYPQAYFLLWATDLADGEIAAETGKVAAALRQGGDDRIGFATVAGLAMDACHWHPSAADHRRIAEVLARHVDAVPGLWPAEDAP